MTYQERREGESIDQMLRKFKRKVKNVDKLSPTKLEKTYFEFINTEK